MKIVTIGVYGFSERQFFAALQRARVDTFCDVRYRRAVRGPEYAFANSQRLQARLAQQGIRYLHFRDLAPSPEVRSRQAAADKRLHVARRKRTQLSSEFICGYEQECLAHFDSAQFVERLGSKAAVVALFCVEREPAACHRSLLAERLHKDLGVEVIHLTPE
jgi:uncharacterized protein (DUF488 family)